MDQTNRTNFAHAQSNNASQMDFIVNDRDPLRDQRAFMRAKRHTLLVRVLRIALPLIAVLVASVVFGAYFWAKKETIEVKIDSTQIDNGRMVMKAPVLNGLDKQKRPYRLTAIEAIQDPSKPSKVEMIKIKANVPMQDGIFADITAGQGFYDAEAKSLKLGGEVNVVTDNGMTIDLEDADIDMAKGTMLTLNPVSMSSAQAKISAERFRVENNGALVIFEDRVKMTIYPDKLQQDKPAEIAETKPQPQ